MISKKLIEAGTPANYTKKKSMKPYEVVHKIRINIEQFILNGYEFSGILNEWLIEKKLVQRDDENDVYREMVMKGLNIRLIKVVDDINYGKSVRVYLKKYLKHVVYVPPNNKNI